MTGTRKKDISLVCIPYIYYLKQFQKENNRTQTLLNGKSKVNAINLAYSKKLGLWI